MVQCRRFGSFAFGLSLGDGGYAGKGMLTAGGADCGFQGGLEG